MSSREVTRGPRLVWRAKADSSLKIAENKWLGLHGGVYFFVQENLDEGPIIAQVAVEYLPNLSLMKNRERLYDAICFVCAQYMERPFSFADLKEQFRAHQFEKLSAEALTQWKNSSKQNKISSIYGLADMYAAIIPNEMSLARIPNELVPSASISKNSFWNLVSHFRSWPFDLNVCFVNVLTAGSKKGWWPVSVNKDKRKFHPSAILQTEEDEPPFILGLA